MFVASPRQAKAQEPPSDGVSLPARSNGQADVLRAASTPIRTSILRVASTPILASKTGFAHGCARASVGPTSSFNLLARWDTGGHAAPRAAWRSVEPDLTSAPCWIRNAFGSGLCSPFWLNEALHALKIVRTRVALAHTSWRHHRLWTTYLRSRVNRRWGHLVSGGGRHSHHCNRHRRLHWLR